MFLEVLQDRAEKKQANQFSFPMLIGAKFDGAKRSFAHVQLFANVVSESSSLDTQEIFLEVTGQIEDIHFHAKSPQNTCWVALRNYSVIDVAKILTLTLHSLRVSLFVNLAKNLKYSENIDSIFNGFFYDAVDACYPGIDLTDEVKALQDLEQLLVKNNFQLKQIERSSSGSGVDSFRAINKAVCQAEELLFKHLNEGISFDRVSEIRKKIYITRFSY